MMTLSTHYRYTNHWKDKRLFTDMNPDEVNFVTSIKKKYKGRLINREKQRLIRHSSKLVRLQLVNKNEVESSSTSTRRGEDNKSTPLAYYDLFKPESGKVEPVNKVLVEGGAGIGKTTLSVSLSEDWACDKLFQQFELLLLLPLRHEKVATASSLPELLKLFHSDEEICKSIDSYLRRKEGENVLVIADGWDELSESQRSEDSFLYQLLFVDFPLMPVVVTSRPSASAPLHNLACVDRFVEIKGFDEADIKEYIQSEFASDQEKAQRLLKQLEYNPLIESVCSIPLNCAIVCHLWHTLKEDLPSTMTQLYEKIILHFICRNLRKLPAYGPTFSMESFADLPEGLKESWCNLSEFAFIALKNDQIVFSKKELPEISKDGNEHVLCFGLLQSVETVLALSSEVSYDFLHLTFMEYLAALHLSKQPLDSSWLKLFYHPRFDVVSRFFFGIRFCGSNAEADVGDVKLAIQHVRGLTLCHCAFEAQNAIVNSEVQFDGKSSDPDNPHDCAAVLYVIDNMQECSDLRICILYCSVREKQIRKLADVLARKGGRLQLTVLWLRDNKLTDKTVSYLFNRASAAFQSLASLILIDNRIGAESIKSITTALTRSSSSGCTLSDLDLSANPIEVSGMQALGNAVREGVLSRLELLSLSGSLTSDANTNASWLTTFVEALSAHCPNLMNLNLSQNNLSVPGATALAKVMLRFGQPRSIGYVRLSLNQTNLGDEGLCAFVDNLESVCHFEDLQLDDNDIHATGVSCLANAVCSGMIVIINSLFLNNNALGLEGALGVGKMLSNNHCQLASLNMFMCELTIAGNSLPQTDPLNPGSSISSEIVRQQLYQMPQNNTITKLFLSRSTFTGNGIHILAGFMCLCSSLDHLFASDCEITSNDLIQLFEILKSSFSCKPFSELEILRLDSNEIDDDGVSALIEHLPSLFPGLRIINLSNNLTVSKEMKERLVEELVRRQEVSCFVKQVY